MDFTNDLKEQFGSYYDNLVVFLPKLVMAIIVCSIIYFIIRMIRKKLITYLLKKADDKLLVNFANSAIGIANFVLILLLFLYIVGQGKIATSILGAAGVSAFVIGFALKDIGENFLAGVILAFDRPFRLGDTIQTNNVEGVITEMSLRDTHLKTFDGKDVYIPNGQIIKNPLFNYTIDGYLRKSFVIGLDYNADIKKARDLILESMSKIEGIINDEKKPKTLISNLGTSTIDVEVQYWLNTFDKRYAGSEIHSQAIKTVLKDLDTNGILLPSTIIELKNYNNLPLKQQ